MFLRIQKLQKNILDADLRYFFWDSYRISMLIFKILFFLVMGIIFSGCSVDQSNDSVDISTFQILESKVTVLENEKEKFEEMYAVLREESSKQAGLTENIADGGKVDFLENEVKKMSQEYEEQKIELTQALQKIENLEEMISDMDLGITSHSAAISPSSLTEKTDKNNPEKKGEEVDTFNESGEKVSKASVIYIQDSAKDGERFLVFEKCDDNGKNCKKYVISEKLIEEEIFLTEKKGVKFLLSGGIEYLGKISNEDYYSVIKNVVLVEIIGSGGES